MSRIVSFYGRRIQRLLPGFASFCFATGFLIALLLPPDGKYYGRCLNLGLFSIFGASNMFFAYFEGNYFDIGIDTFAQCTFKHTWSLGVEEQFYCIVPPIILLIPKRKACVLGVACLVSLFACFLIGLQSSKLAFYLLPSRLWEMAAGGWLYFLQEAALGSDRGRSIGKHANMLLQFTALLFILAGLICTPSQSGFPFPWAALSVFGTVCYITSGCFEGAYLNSMLAADVPVFVGKISYLIYLWHWPVITLLGEFDSDRPLDRGTFLKFMGCGATTAVFSVSCYYFIETPFRSWRPRNTSTLFVALVATIVALDGWLGMLNGGPLHGALFVGYVPKALVEGEHFQRVEVAKKPPAQTKLGKGRVGKGRDEKAPHIVASHAFLRNYRQAEVESTSTSHAHDSVQIQSGQEHEGVDLEFPALVPDGIKLKGLRTCKCNHEIQTVFRPPGAEINATDLPPCLDTGVLKTATWESFIHSCWNHPVQLAMSRIKKCLNPKRDALKRALFALGDSHTGMMSTAYRLAFHGRMSVNWFAVGYGCAFFGSSMGYVAEGQLKKNCETINDMLFSHLMSQLRSGDVVIVGNSEDRKTTRFVRSTCPESVPNCTQNDGGLTEIYLKHMKKLIDGVASRGAKLVILGDAPRQRFADPAHDCSPDKFSQCRVSHKDSLWSSPSLVELHEELLHSTGGFVFWNYHDLLCLPLGQDMQTYSGILQPAKKEGARYCYPFVPGTGMAAYIDNTHLSDLGAAYLAPFLCAALEDAGVI